MEHLTKKQVIRLYDKLLENFKTTLVGEAHYKKMYEDEHDRAEFWMETALNDAAKRRHLTARY